MHFLARGMYVHVIVHTLYEGSASKTNMWAALAHLNTTMNNQINGVNMDWDIVYTCQSQF